jgi:riboflavin synthase
MFTGIVEEMGALVERDGDLFTFSASSVLEDIRLGDSVAVNGCCLTVVRHDTTTWSANISEETKRRTSLDALHAEQPVNLERPLRLNDRLGGHLVQGHVDAVAVVVDAAPILRVRVPQTLLRYVVEKGSVTLDGVSLTVVNLFDDGFDVALIPHTMNITTLGSVQPGALVNIEVDLIAKYAERLMTPLMPVL